MNPVVEESDPFGSQLEHVGEGVSAFARLAMAAVMGVCMAAQSQGAVLTDVLESAGNWVVMTSGELDLSDFAERSADAGNALAATGGLQLDYRGSTMFVSASFFAFDTFANHWALLHGFVAELGKDRISWSSPAFSLPMDLDSSPGKPMPQALNLPGEDFASDIARSAIKQTFAQSAPQTSPFSLWGLVGLIFSTGITLVCVFTGNPLSLVRKP